MVADDEVEIPPLSDADALKSAELLHQQAQYLLDDEISFAGSLKDTRKTSAALITVVVGIGIFRFDLYREKIGELVVPVWAGWTIKSFFLLAILLLLVGVFLIYTERNPWDSDDSVSPPEGGEEPESRSPKSGTAALAVLYLDNEVLEEFEQRPPIEVVHMKTDGLRVAYRRLKRANRRVRKRLNAGTALALIGLGLVGLAFGLYTLTIGAGK